MAVAEDTRTDRPATPRWTLVASEALCVVGMFAASYLTWAHYTSASKLGCPDTGVINCTKVTTSPESVIAGVPVSVAGMCFFAVMAVLCSPWAWRSSIARVRLARVAASVVGVGMILWLLYVELFRLDAICLWCTAVHVITVLLFFTVAFGSAAVAIGRR